MPVVPSSFVRGLALMVTGAVFAAACAGDPPATPATTVTSVAIPAPTTTSTISTTTTTTTTTSPGPVVPEGVPPEAFALVGAPMPDVDLTFEDGFDGDAWFAAYAAWNEWAFANPEAGLDSLDLWVLAGSPQHESFADQLLDSVNRGWITVRSTSLTVLDLETADEFVASGFAQLNLLSVVAGSVWIVDRSGQIVLEEEFDRASRRSLVEVRRDEDGRWKLASWE